MGNDPINDLGLFCPSGGDFYICQESDIQFVGCCGIDPCKDRTGRCPGDQLFPASFDAGRYFGIGAQTCVEPFEADHPNPWYTCTYDGVGDPFMGCCATNACGQGHCPDGDLIAARLSDDPYDADAFISPDGNSYSNPTDSGGSSLSTGAIVGIAVGGAAFVVILGLLFWWRRRKQQQAAAEGNHVQTIPHPDQLDISQAAPYSPYKDTYQSSPTMVNSGSPHSTGNQTPQTSVYGHDRPYARDAHLSPPPGSLASWRTRDSQHMSQQLSPGVVSNDGWGGEGTGTQNSNPLRLTMLSELDSNDGIRQNYTGTTQGGHYPEQPQQYHEMSVGEQYHEMPAESLSQQTHQQPWQGHGYRQ